MNAASEAPVCACVEALWSAASPSGTDCGCSAGPFDVALTGTERFIGSTTQLQPAMTAPKAIANRASVAKVHFLRQPNRCLLIPPPSLSRWSLLLETCGPHCCQTRIKVHEHLLGMSTNMQPPISVLCLFLRAACNHWKISTSISVTAMCQCQMRALTRIHASSVHHDMC